MNIDINTNLVFTSSANPVKPFVIRTKRGKLNVAEVTTRDLKREGFMQALTKFFCKNFASLTKDPAWKVFRTGTAFQYEQALNDFINYYGVKIRKREDDMTLLIAKDKRNKIQGACLSYGYTKIPNLNNTVCYVDSIAVNPTYRGFNIGKVMLEKTLDSAKHQFTDAFLAGDRCAYGFYKKLGFEPLKEEFEHQKKVIDYLSKRRSDYPKYIEFLTKPLQENSPRWFNEIKGELD